MALFSEIEDIIPKLSTAKKEVAKYILNNWQESAFISAAKIAKNVNVSESVVVRTAQDLGYSGFPELQKAIHNIIRGQLTGLHSKDNDIDKVMINSIHKNSKNFIQKSHDLTINNIKQTVSNNSIETFKKIVQLIINSNKIVILARRNSLGPANILNIHLNEILTNTRLVNASLDTLFDEVRGLNQQDLLITIGISSYGKRMVQAAQFASERKITQISITDSVNSPFTQFSRYKLISYVKSYSFSNSHVSTLFLIDILIQMVSNQAQGQFLKTLEELNNIHQRIEIDYLP